MLRIIDEIEIAGVFERGVPNKERVVLKINVSVDLSDYMLLLGVPIAEQLAYPLEGALLHFEKDSIDPPAWVFVYTGPGERRFTKEIRSGDPALVLHWGKSTTILNDERLVPILLSVEGVLVGPHKQSQRLLPPAK